MTFPRALGIFAKAKSDAASGRSRMTSAYYCAIMMIVGIRRGEDMSSTLNWDRFTKRSTRAPLGVAYMYYIWGKVNGHTIAETVLCTAREARERVAELDEHYGVCTFQHRRAR